MLLKIVRILEVYNIPKHGSVIEVMSVKEVELVAEIRGIDRLKVYRPRKSGIAIDITVNIVHIIGALNDRVVDVRIVDRDPSHYIRIDLQQFIKCFPRQVAGLIHGTILYKVPGRKGHTLQIERIQNCISGEKHHH